MPHHVKHKNTYFNIGPAPASILFQGSSTGNPSKYPVGLLLLFDTWQSGALPYPLLLLIQIVMIIPMRRLIWHFYTGRVTPKKKRGKIRIIFGSIYFIALIFRMLAGQTFGADYYWLNTPLPTLFHYVFFSYVLCCGHYHCRYGRR